MNIKRTTSDECCGCAVSSISWLEIEEPIFFPVISLQSQTCLCYCFVLIVSITFFILNHQQNYGAPQMYSLLPSCVDNRLSHCWFSCLGWQLTSHTSCFFHLSVNWRTMWTVGKEALPLVLASCQSLWEMWRREQSTCGKLEKLWPFLKVGGQD